MSRGIREFDLLRQQFQESLEIPFSDTIWGLSVRVMAQENLESLDAIHGATARHLGSKTSRRLMLTSDACHIRKFGSFAMMPTYDRSSTIGAMFWLERNRLVGS